VEVDGIPWGLLSLGKWFFGFGFGFLRPLKWEVAIWWSWSPGGCGRLTLFFHRRLRSRERLVVLARVAPMLAGVVAEQVVAEAAAEAEGVDVVDTGSRVVAADMEAVMGVVEVVVVMTNSSSGDKIHSHPTGKVGGFGRCGIFLLLFVEFGFLGIFGIFFCLQDPTSSNHHGLDSSSNNSRHRGPVSRSSLRNRAVMDLRPLIPTAVSMELQVGRG
jgi:hypothetical protein